LLFGLFVYLGTKVVDFFNRTLMVGLIVTYVLLVVLGAPHVNSSYLFHRDWLAAPLVLPILLISFGFHNMIPSLKTYLQGDVKRLRLAVIAGSALPLIIYIVWEWLILGLVPLDGHQGLNALSSEGEMATYALKSATEASQIVDIAQYFAFFAILTSFLGNSLSFVDFLADGLRVKKNKTGKLLLCALVVLPPFVMSVIYPHLFLTALNYAGAFGAVTLFGILPVLMVWSGRYIQKVQAPKMLAGGKGTLLAIMLFALSIIALQIGVMVNEGV
jgi:tyrosine-specific transport protein